MGARLRWLALWAATSVLAGCASAGQTEKWSLRQNEHGCVISEYVADRRVALTLVGFPGTKDGGIMEMVLDDSTLPPVATPMSPVQLEFDTGTVEGYLIREVSPGVPGVRMMTYALSQITSQMKGAQRVEVISGKTTATFDLPGFAASLPLLLNCAETKI